MPKYLKFALLLFITFQTQHLFALPENVKSISDIAYGTDVDQTLDVYIPKGAKQAPVILMVHGGAWEGGDKANKDEFENKVNHWASKGFVFISINYRTMPKLKPVDQIKDVEAALLFSQKKASKWGGAADKFILMGHSSGAHLVSLVSSNFNSLKENGVKPWLGTVSLDISGYDIVKKVLGPKPSDFYKEKFGSTPKELKIASPFHMISDKIPPFLAVCSTRSMDACIQAENFVKKAKSFGTMAKTVPVDLSHMEINSRVGKDTCYTQHIDQFFKSLSPSIPALIGEADSVKCSNNKVSKGL